MRALLCKRGPPDSQWERSIEFAGSRVFFHSFESAPKVFKQPSSTGTGHLSPGQSRREVGSSLSSVSCVLNTDKTQLNVLTLICVDFIYSTYLKDSIQRVYTQTSVIHFKCILTQIEWFCAIVNTLDIHSTHYQLFTINRICVYIE